MKERQRITVSLSDWNQEQIIQLCKRFGERKAEIVRRAIDYMHQHVIVENNQHKQEKEK